MGTVNRNSSNRFITTQRVSITSGSKTVGSAFGDQSYQIRVVGNAACNINIFDANAATTAATNSMAYLADNFPEYFTVTPGQYLSVIQCSTDGLVTATNGALWVTEVGA